MHGPPIDRGRIGRALAEVGPAGPTLAERIAVDLERRYSEPHRRYHTLEHVAEVLAEIDRLAPGRGPEEAALLDLAAYFHDAIYEVTAAHGASEAASADLLAAVCVELGSDEHGPFVVELDRLVRLTVGHEVEEFDTLGAVLVDADLWILSAPAHRYDRYARDVRAEYAHVPDELWRQGRGAVIDRFLVAIDDLYASGAAGDRTARRTRAGENLRRERAALDG